MKIERLERIVIGVNDLDTAEKLYSDIFGLQFIRTRDLVEQGEIVVTRTVTEHAEPSFEQFYRRPAFCGEGIELLETKPAVEAEGIRSFCFKVADLEEAKAEMKAKGIRLVEEIDINGVKEAIYHPDDTLGVRVVLNEFEGPDIVSAILKKEVKGAPEFEKLERVVVTVGDLDEGENLFSDLFGFTFLRTTEKIEKGEIKRKRAVTKHGNKDLSALQRRPAFSPNGLEVLGTIPPIEKGIISSYAVKVADLEKAKARMAEKGIRRVEDLEFGGVKEAIYHPDDLHGARLVLIEYHASDIVSAILS